MEYSAFVSLHETQLKNSGIPSELWPSLHKKLVGEIYDAGEYVGLFRVEEEEEEGAEEDSEENENKEAGVS